MNLSHLNIFVKMFAVFNGKCDFIGNFAYCMKTVENYVISSDDSYFQRSMSKRYP